MTMPTDYENIQFQILLDKIKELETELEEWRFTNKVDELERYVTELKKELVKFSRLHAAERLRADQGWERYESANKQRIALEDSLMEKTLEAASFKERLELVSLPVDEKVDYIQKLESIVYSMYQFAGAHDAPEHILDVLCSPQTATEEQIDAILPYYPSVR